MKSLSTPSTVHELDGEPIEKLGMCRCDTWLAEVFGGGDDSSAKVILPNTIDHHAGGERMVGLRQPFRKCQPSARCGGILERRRDMERLAGCFENRRYVGHHSTAAVVPLASPQQIKWVGHCSHVCQPLHLRRRAKS